MCGISFIERLCHVEALGTDINYGHVSFVEHRVGSQKTETKLRMIFVLLLTLEQLSHLKMVPLFFPVLVTLIPAPWISVLAGAAAEESSGMMSSSLASTFGIIVADDEVSCPLADVKEVPVWGTPCGGGEPARDRFANDDSAAAAV